MNELSLHPGDPVTYQGKLYQIRQLTGNLKTVELVDPISGRFLRAPIEQLFPAPAPDASAAQEVPLELVSDEHWAVARRRMAIILPLLNRGRDRKSVQAAAQQHGVGTATLYRWIKLYETTHELSQLLPTQSDGGQGKTRLPAELEAILRASVDEVYLTKQRYSLKRVYLDVIDRCKRHEIAIPHLNTVRNRVRAIRGEKVLRFRHSHSAADDKYNPNKGHFPGADFPLAVVQIDHTPGDVMLVDDENRTPLGKPWITMAIDVYSRMVVGFYISFESPGALGTGMCVASSLLPKEGWLKRLDVPGEWPCWGKMKKLYADNAKEFRGNMLKRSCEEYGIDLEWRPVRKARYGGHIERLLGTFAGEIHSLPGTTFSNSKDKGEYDSADKAALTLGEFEKWLLHLIVNIYHRRLHSALGRSPLEVFEDGVYQKTGLPPRLQNEQKVKFDFLPYVERTIQEYGVVLDYIHYYSDVLRPWIHAMEGKLVKARRKRKFIFKRDPRDISVLFFYDPEAKTYFPIPYSDLSRPPMTLWEHHYVLARLTKNGVKKVDEVVFFEAYQALHLIEEQAVAKTQVMRRERRLAKTRSNRAKSLKQELAINPEAGGALRGDTASTPRLPPSPIRLTAPIEPFDELEYGAPD